MSSEGDGYSAYLEGFSRLTVSDEVSGLLKSFVSCDGNVEFSKRLFDQRDPESPVSVECAIKIEDDALRWQGVALLAVGFGCYRGTELFYEFVGILVDLFRGSFQSLLG